MILYDNGADDKSYYLYTSIHNTGAK